MITIPYTPDLWKNSYTGKEKTIYKPLINAFLIANHKVGKATPCYLDSGASVNLSPAEYALVFLGFSEKSLKRSGSPLDLQGIGGITKTAYGHRCDLHSSDFRLENIMVYFLEGHKQPLLGRLDFMDKFKQIVFNEDKKCIEIIR